MEIFEGLQKLGLSEKEANVYLSLFQLSEAAVGEISKRTGIHRRSCYDTLNSLQEHGLVSYSLIDGVKKYRATGLSALNAMVMEKANIVEELLPKLEERKKEEQEPVIEIFTGVNAVKGVFEDMLKDSNTIHIYGGHNPARIYLKYYYPKFTKGREKIGMWINALHPDAPGIREIVKSTPLWKAKFIDKKFFSPNFWNVQGDKIHIYFWSENPIIVRIKDKNLAKTYLGAFKQLWKVAKK